MEVKSFNINDTKEFKIIQKEVINSIIKRYEVRNLRELNDKGSEWGYQKKIDLRSDNKLAILVDNNLRTILRNLNIDSDFIQFPANIRLFFPKGSNDVKDYDTDILHCDHWSQAPSDSRQGFLYINHPPKDSTYLSFYSFDEKTKKIIDSYKGPYRNAPNLNLSEIAVPRYDGILHFWNCDTPHRTIRQGSSCTISIDFRVRNNSLVFKNDLNKDASDWNDTKMTSLGVYWINSIKSFNSLEDKIKFEIKESFKFGNKYKSLREVYIKKFYLDKI